MYNTVIENPQEALWDGISNRATLCAVSKENM